IFCVAETAVVMVSTHSVQRVGYVPVPKQRLFPRLQVRDRIRKEPQAVVRRKHRNSQHVPHRDEHEEVLHVHPQPEGVGHHPVEGHTIHHALRGLYNLPLLLGLPLFLLGASHERSSIVPSVITLSSGKVLRPFHDVFWPKPPEVPQCVLYSHPHRPPRGHSRRTRDVGGADEVRQRSKGIVSDEGLPPLLVPPYICRVPEAGIPPEVLVECRLIDYVSPRYVHQDGTTLRNRELLRAYHPLGEFRKG